MCGILISGLAYRFSKRFSVAEESLFSSSCFAKRASFNLVKEVLDHLWAILAVYLCIFFKVIIKWKVDAERFVGRCTKRLGTKTAFLYPKEERKRQKKKHKRISVARDIHEMLKRK